MSYDNACRRLIREDLLMEYRRQQGWWLQQQTGRSAEECLAFVERILQERFRDQQVTISLTGKNGDPEVQQLPLSQLLRQSRSLIVTPSGSGYLPSDREPSLISQMIATKKAERKQVKKRQLQAEGDGDQVTAKQCWYKQASIKIGLNSLPGQLASSSNIFYDKGGYNSITSMARNIIPRAYLTCERLLGGNFAWLLEEQVISYLQSLLHHLPEELAIRNQLQRWQLKWPTAIEVSAFLKDGWQRNSRAVVSMERVDRILWRLSPEQLAFIYYYGNLRHLCWDNEERLRPYLRQLLTLPEQLELQDGVTVKDIYAFDSTVLAVTMVVTAERFAHQTIDVLCREQPERIPEFHACCRLMQERLAELWSLVSFFTEVDVDIVDLKTAPYAFRNTTVLSDTDSVIFTTAAWDDWYREGQVSDGVTQDSYNITAICIYLLHHVVRGVLLRFSRRFGIAPAEEQILEMKNEFLYPIMLLYDVKKTYAALQLIKEGVFLPKPKPDIKGQQLRGSSMGDETLTFTEDLIVRDIMYPAMRGQLDVRQILQRILAYERQIYQSLAQGETTYLTVTSLKPISNYTNPDNTCVVRAHRLWNELFAKEYGEVIAPIKVPMFPLRSLGKIRTVNGVKEAVLDPQLYAELRQVKPRFAERLKRWFTPDKLLPSNMLLSPLLPEIPPEMRVLMDRRAVVQTNLRPAYLTLLSLGIQLDPDYQVLLTDMCRE